MNQNSPHFSRIFSALFHICLWTFLIGFIGLNIIIRIKTNPAWSNNLGALIHPLSFREHITLARTGWSNGNVEQAKTELLIAESVKRLHPEILGDSDPANLLSEWEHEPEQIAKEEGYWEQIIRDKLDYRDAFITLSGLNYRLYRDTKAKEYLATARVLDPNNVFVQKLETLLNPKELDK